MTIVAGSVQRPGALLQLRAAVAALLLLLPVTAFAQSAPADEPATVPVADGYRIGPEDVLDISVWNQPELNRVVPVRPDGMISLPLVNDVQAGGRTPMELRDALAAQLAEYVSAPSVSVIVSEIHSFKVSVVGEVKTPGRYELRSRATVLDVIALAEGFTEYASKHSIVILRPEGDATRRIHFDFRHATSDQGGNWAVQPGDIIIVP